jgi:hypothetical protein
MVWRRLLVPAAASLRELHGVIQVAMGWEGVHLFQFHLRAARYGSFELSAASPDVNLARWARSQQSYHQPPFRLSRGQRCGCVC